MPVHAVVLHHHQACVLALLDQGGDDGAVGDFGADRDSTVAELVDLLLTLDEEVGSVVAQGAVVEAHVRHFRQADQDRSQDHDEV